MSSFVGDRDGRGSANKTASNAQSGRRNVIMRAPAPRPEMEDHLGRGSPIRGIGLSAKVQRTADWPNV
jgi:hypothetical protein